MLASCSPEDLMVETEAAGVLSRRIREVIGSGSVVCVHSYLGPCMYVWYACSIRATRRRM